MDDFLHNLRSGKLKQPDRGRRDYTDYKGPQRRTGHERRKPDYYTKVTNENFAMVKESLNQLTEAQIRVGDALSTLEETGGRIADALEAIIGVLSGQTTGFGRTKPDIEAATLSPTDITPDSANSHEKKKENPTPPPTRSKLSNEDKPKLLDIIATLRSERKSWEKIAQHIDALNFPTLSGKGKWRGQAIKKFYDAHTRNSP